MTSAMTVSNLAEVQLAPNFRMTKVGLKIAGNPTLEDWKAIGKKLKLIESGIQFALGDWKNHGATRTEWGEKYAQAIEETGYSEKSLREFSWVASAVDPSIRMDNLPFAHHHVVAPLDADKQRYYLQLAVEQELSVAELRDLIKRDTRQHQLEAHLAIAGDIPENALIIHGDMLDILAEMRDCFDLVIADPPYNVTEWTWDVIGTDAQFIQETHAWLAAIKPTLKSEYNLFWFCSPQYMADIELLLRRHELPIQSRLIWHRRNMAMGSDARHKFIDSYEMIYHVGNRELNFPLEWTDARFDVQTFAVPQTNFTDEKLHPTQKPLELIRRLVAFGSYPGDSVLDPFAGSGTTGHACYLEGNRNCTLIERDDTYVRAATARLAQLQQEQSQAAGVDR